jgi:hypothetical protein
MSFSLCDILCLSVVMRMGMRLPLVLIVRLPPWLVVIVRLERAVLLLLLRPRL